DVDGNTPAQLNNVWSSYGITFPILAGCQDLFWEFGNGAVPTTVILDPDGIVRGTWEGFTPQIVADQLALVEAWLPTDTPRLRIDDITLSGDANGDGRPDPGESTDLTLSLFNAVGATEALTTTAILSTDAAGITITTGQITFGAIAGGQSAVGSPSFTFDVAPGVDPFLADFTVSLSSTYAGSAEPWTRDLQTTFMIGRPARLVVDSDGTQDDNENWMSRAMQTRGLVYDMHSPTDGPVTAQLLALYDKVFWLGGINDQDVSVADAAALADYMDGGGKLLLSSQYALGNPATAQFFDDYFHVSLDTDVAQPWSLHGDVDDPRFRFSRYQVVSSGGAGNLEAADRLSVLPGAMAMLNWEETETGTAAVTVENAYYRAIFAGFPIEAGPINADSSTQGAINFVEFLETAEEFLDNVPSVTSVPVLVSFQINMECLDPADYAGGVSISGTDPLLGDGIPGTVLLIESSTPGVFEGSVSFPAGTDLLLVYQYHVSPNGVDWLPETYIQHHPLELSDALPVMQLSEDQWAGDLCRPRVHIQPDGGNTLLVWWDPVGGAIYYDVYGSTDPFFVPSEATLLGSIASPAFNWSADQGQFFFIVKAIN
ncbi:MAG: hypothetical protein KDC10_08420, partial [Calditrichaeota bacterium]|nr:hypothetical protein [Calditrichota bacterium]